MSEYYFRVNRKDEFTNEENKNLVLLIKENEFYYATTLLHTISEIEKEINPMISYVFENIGKNRMDEINLNRSKNGKEPMTQTNVFDYCKNYIENIKDNPNLPEVVGLMKKAESVEEMSNCAENFLQESAKKGTNKTNIIKRKK